MHTDHGSMARFQTAVQGSRLVYHDLMFDGASFIWFRISFHARHDLEAIRCLGATCLLLLRICVAAAVAVAAALPGIFTRGLHFHIAAGASTALSAAAAAATLFAATAVARAAAAAAAVLRGPRRGRRRRRREIHICTRTRR